MTDHRVDTKARVSVREVTDADLDLVVVVHCGDAQPAAQSTEGWLASAPRDAVPTGRRWDDVHFDTGRMEITQALTSIGYRLEFSRLKTAPADATSSSTPTRWPCSPTGDAHTARRAGRSRSR